MPGLPMITVSEIPSQLPEGVVMIDVREADEWEAGHVDGSMHLPMSEIGGRAEEIPSDCQLLIVCKVGGRSAQVTQWLVSQGRDVVNLDGGLLAWEHAGRPLVTDAGAAGFVA